MAALLIFAACKREPKAEPEVASADTVEVVEPVDTDSVVVPEPPKTADENFDDFLYSFMKSRRRQLARISFPLPNIVEKRMEIRPPLFQSRCLHHFFRSCPIQELWC